MTCSAVAELGVEPEARESPVPHHGFRRDREDLGGFFDAEATEDAGLARVVLGEGVRCIS